jgi:hypothetical protein
MRISLPGGAIAIFSENGCVGKRLIKVSPGLYVCVVPFVPSGYVIV